MSCNQGVTGYRWLPIISALWRKTITELAESIGGSGIIQSLIVRANPRHAINRIVVLLSVQSEAESISDEPFSWSAAQGDKQPRRVPELALTLLNMRRCIEPE